MPHVGDLLSIRGEGRFDPGIDEGVGRSRRKSGARLRRDRAAVQRNSGEAALPPPFFRIEKQARLEGDRWGFAGASTNTAFSGAWGVSFAANLTPDQMTGTGIWTFDIFKNTIRNGRHWGVGRPLNPPMPWFNYRHMTDEDLEAVFTYIHTLKPIYNEVQQPLPPA